MRTKGVLIGFSALLQAAAAAFGGVRSAAWSADDGAVVIHLSSEEAVPVSSAEPSAGTDRLSSLEFKKHGKAKGGVFRDSFTSLDGLVEELDGKARIYRIGHEGQTMSYLALYVLTLQPGENWISLWGDGPSLKVKDIFGHGLPVASTPGTSSQLTWYRDLGYPFKEQALWLQGGDAPMWLSKKDAEPADEIMVPAYRGVVLTIPENSETVHLPIILTLPSEPGPFPIQGPGAYNVVGNPYPWPVKLQSLGLGESGMIGAGLNPNNSDEIRIFAPGSGSSSSPIARILADSKGSLSYWTGGERGSPAGDYMVSVGQGFLLKTAGSVSEWDWQIAW